MHIIFQHPVAILKLQYHLIFSLYATFDMTFVSIISTLHVSARIGHQRFTAAGETDCPQRKAWHTDESTRRKMHKQLTTGSRSQLPTYKWINRRFQQKILHFNVFLTNRTIHF
jgi:hypothetical protein